MFVTNFQIKENIFNDHVVQQCSVVSYDSVLPNPVSSSVLWSLTTQCPAKPCLQQCSVVSYDSVLPNPVSSSVLWSLTTVSCQTLSPAVFCGLLRQCPAKPYLQQCSVVSYDSVLPNPVSRSDSSLLSTDKRFQASYVR